jgi:hypothetical protein
MREKLPIALWTQRGARPRLAEAAALAGRAKAMTMTMTGPQGVGSARLGDTLFAAAVLMLLIAGWVQGLGVAPVAALWALRSYLLPTRQAQFWFDSGSLRNGVYSASSLPAAST